MSFQQSYQRIAVVFDRRVRPETTGTYCLRALRKLAEARHVPPEEIGQAAEDSFDLYVRIDDGLREPWPEHLHPSVYWAIDTHMDFLWALEEAGRFDLVFAAQRDGAEQLKSAGITSATWLPLAADPEIHRRHDLPPRWDVSFIGNISPEGERARLLKLIEDEFPNCFVGRRYFEEMAEVYSQSRIVFNRSIKNDINMRVFEALAAGALLVTNDLTENGLTELLKDGKHLVTYRDGDDLVAKIRKYLDDESARKRIARSGHDKVIAHHTYQHRMQTVLDSAAQYFGKAEVQRRRLKRNEVSESSPATNGQLEQSNRMSAKDLSYFEFARPEVVALIPPSARSVLDVGCGAGCLGEALKRRQDARVTGIEMDLAAARLARGRLDAVIEGNLEADEIEFSTGQFDCVVCADVLEHLRCPETVLKKIHRWLAPGGSLIVSLPNVRHHSVVRSLLAGNWTYETAGLLDQDHVRFFTRREMEKLFYRCGFAIENRLSITGPGDPDPGEPEEFSRLVSERLGYNTKSSEEAAEFFAYQFVFSANPMPIPRLETTSIVLVTHNQLAYTRACLNSVRHFTDEPYELIVVDNGSTDGTVPWLRRQADVKLIENVENRGFPAAVNQGMRAATGEQILLLNNDTVVTTGWLRRLLDAFAQDSRIGLAGPCTNNVSGPQQVVTSYRDLGELDGFAWDWGKEHAGKLQDVDRLVGFCLLIRRELLERVGFLDERFGIGCFEDDDYCRRALEAGYRAVIVWDSLIHHFGSMTFRSSGLDFGAILEQNRQKYDKKWAGNKTRQHGKAAEAEMSTFPRRGRQQAGGPMIEPAPVRLSLCMIVRDNVTTIRPCLESIRPWVDEMIVVDTGSKDRTPEICKELGARVEYFPWCDDFSAARNESLKYASGDWVFWMDSDDTIPEECGRKLRELVGGGHANSTLGYVMQVHCPGSQAGDLTVVDHVKLFRNRPDVRFEFRIHEQILPAIRRAGGEVKFTDIYVVHSGSDQSAEGQQKKLERDFRILKLDLEERPDHPFVLFNLGMTCSEASRLQEARQSLERCIEVSSPAESHVRKAYAILLAVLMRSQEPDSAFQVCESGLNLFPDDRELIFRRAMLQQAAGRLEAARDDYLTVLTPQTERHFASRDVGIVGYKARHNLALVYEEMECPDDALTQWQTILTEKPNYQPAQSAIRRLLSRESV